MNNNKGMAITKISLAILLLAVVVTIVAFLNKDSSDDFQTRSDTDETIIESVTSIKERLDDFENANQLPEDQKEDIIEMQKELKENILIAVPFSSQAPFADWDDVRKQDGCEEASSLMAMYWVNNKKLGKFEARKEIQNISDWEKEKYGSFNDTSAKDTAERILQGYFKYNNFEIKNNITINDIINTLREGKIIIAPADGQALHNPYFTAPGPERHMLVILGYNKETNEFITNDPGTKRGENYKYNTEVLYNAIRDYPTGNHEPIEGIEKNIIIINKN